MHKVVILGAESLGLTSAIYLARANMIPVVIEGDQVGGFQINEIEESYGPPIALSLDSPEDRILYL